ncbi:type V CRISPR-associated protein Cas12k [Phormidium sp. LEGE 05292]|uniref:type V CRISPR-associated protein Cas12k n=1 Tax=[Phormidium] sp. LEGE 05292 TaxID=767427 RepID=UPI001880D03E|nr:type V CRISPR-associated protein Cas12k [Phormidium sp. LEGE 05292]MBE9223995.1 type V CRISPR-associated protein Cas12k [Phormidium sp. LEGE 05292]
MSLITIQCRLVASESTRQKLWKLMVQRNTPLINELLEQVARHPDFETWRQKGKLPADKDFDVVSQLCKSLKTDPRFTGQPGRFYSSAISVVKYIYKSWLAIQKQLQHKLDGKRSWLEMLKSDAQLVEASGYTLDALRTKAAEILAEVILQLESGKEKQGNSKAAAPNRNLSKLLFEAYRNTDDILRQCAICYLIKNGCKVNDTEEDPEKFVLRRRKVEVEIERLSEKLASRVPKGRELTNTRWLETLDLATTTVPQDNHEAKGWQDILLTKFSCLPFPVLLGGEDLRWSKNQEGRLCVEFTGLTELIFEVYCDRRQLPWFQRFWEDQETKRESKGQHSTALFALRSGRLAWQEGEGKGEPWQVHRLALHCTIDTRLWTKEGTEQVRSQKAAQITSYLTKKKKEDNLNKNQQVSNRTKAKQTSLKRMDTPFNRPSQPIYEGRSHILVGVSLGLDKPATVAVVDVIAQTVLTYRSVRQLLGENYPLLNRQRLEQQDGAHQRHKAQKRSAPNDFGASELGQYIDRLLAKEIVAIAISFQAGSIVLPDLKDMREIIQSELETRAQQKHPGLVEVQKLYAKQYRINIHQWSYNRLIESIQAQAAKAGISIEVGMQTRLGTVSVQEKARELAFSAYQSRVSKA